MIKVNDKVMIPQDDHPEINFVGLLIGPRGNTLKCKLGCIRISFCMEKRSPKQPRNLYSIDEFISIKPGFLNCPKQAQELLTVHSSRLLSHGVTFFTCVCVMYFPELFLTQNSVS